ncbi:SPFH domain-containing protein [bacterium]|nr:SPFH domain-containing protein [bacterium]
MSIFGGQMRSVIEWKDPSPDVLIWRWDGSGDELKNASKLLVNPGQAAIFVYEGQVQAVHDFSGLFELRTANIPFWTTISKFMQGFESEHKANIFFIRVTEFLNQKWGTKAPIKYDDPKYKFPVGLRAFGNFSFHITNVRKFFTEIASTRSIFNIAEIRNIIVDRLLTPLTDLFAESGYGYSEIDKKRVELSKALQDTLAEIFVPLGFELTDFRIENTDFDEDTKKRIDRISDKMADAQAIRALGEVDPASMRNYATVEQLGALHQAANNPGGTAGVGVGLGAGMGLGQTMTSMFNTPAGFTGGRQIPCTKCQNSIDETAKFCPQCGTPNSRNQMVACVSCKKSIPANTKFCPECGGPQTAKCSSCKADLTQGAKFCPHCGGSNS